MASWYEFVRTDQGRYFLQVFDIRRWPRHGFALYDGERFWPGGRGVAENWKTVESLDVPESVRMGLRLPTDKYGWVKTALGQYMVTIRSWSCYPRSGYALFDGKRMYPGGYGLSVSWEVVPPEEVPESVRKEFELACERLGF